MSATDASITFTAHHALQIHGAYGYSREFPVERYFRNARGAMIYEETRKIRDQVPGEVHSSPELPLRKPR